jgi:hypothetical protein
MKISQLVRRLATIVAILALLMASDPALAAVLFAPSQPCNCTMLFCPMHHPASSNSRVQTINCGPEGQSCSNSCSMSACNHMQFHAMFGTPLVLVGHLVTYSRDLMQPAPVSPSSLFNSEFRTPALPPPRPAFA